MSVPLSHFTASMTKQPLHREQGNTLHDCSPSEHFVRNTLKN